MNATTTSDNQEANLKCSGLALFPSNIESTTRGHFWEAVYYGIGELIAFFILAVVSGAATLSSPILSAARTLNVDLEEARRIFVFSTSAQFGQIISSPLDAFRFATVILVYGAMLFTITIPLVANIASRRGNPERAFRLGMNGVLALLVVWGVVGIMVGARG